MAADRPADAVKAFREALAAAPSSQLVYRLTAALIRTHDLVGAITLLTDWVAQHPDDLQAVQQLSDVNINAHHEAEAAKQLELILSKKPHNAMALNNLAWLYQKVGDPRAEGLARQAYILSSDGQTADTLGWILISSGKLTPGVALMRQASNQAGSDPGVQYHFAVALNDTGQRDAAIKVLKAIVTNQTDIDEKADAQHLLSELTKE
jgi:predicted Zn-dependent protease